MKKQTMLLVMILALGVGVAGCGKEAPATEPNTERSTETEMTVKDANVGEIDTEVTTEFYLPQEETDKLEEQYRAVAKEIQQKVADRDMEALSEYVAYPCYVGIANVMVVQSKEDFVKLDPMEVFPDELVDIIKNTDVDSLELYDAGYVISGENGKPNITIGQGEDGTVGITGFNY